MRVRLADVGEIRAPFGYRRDTRLRAMRFPDDGGGGGEAEEDPEQETEEDPEQETKEDSESVPKAEMDKAIRRRDRAIAEKRKLAAELDELKKGKDDKPDPLAEANTRIVRTSAHGILRAFGIESKADRAAVLDMLKLDDIPVSADGADEDEMEDRLKELRRILGVTAPNGRRTPRVNTTDRGREESNTDPDTDRYRRILGR